MKTEDECETSIRKSSVEKVDVAECLLCEKECSASELREAMTMQLNDKPNRCALALQDELLTKLSSGDVVA